MKNNLAKLSDEQLEHIANGHNQNEPDYSHSEQRGMLDNARDLAYGALKMPTHAITGALNMIPGMHSDANEQLENIKSPHPSSTGDALQTAGSLLIPGKIAAKTISEARVIPKGMEIANQLRKSFSPEAQAEEFQTGLTPGVETAEENIGELTKRIQQAHKVRESQAVAKKNEVMELAGEKTLPREAEYLKQRESFHHFPPEVRDLHQQFINKPTLKNADELRMQIGNEIGHLSRLSRTKGLEPAQRTQLSQFKKAYDALKTDTVGMLEKIDPNLASKMQEHWSDYETNVVPYRSSRVLRDILKKGADAGLTKANIASEFKFPTKEIKKILEDIGMHGKSNIAKNEYQGASNAEDLAKMIMQSKKTGGMQHYVTPEMEKIAEELGKQVGRQKIIKPFLGALGGFAGGTVVGHPLIGSALGTAFGLGKDALIKLLSQAPRS
jgi:hypothetical protein